MTDFDLKCSETVND
jgi:hypothetical protein